MIGAIMLLIGLILMIVILLSSLIYGIIYFLKEKEPLIAILLFSAFVVVLFGVVGGILAEMGI